MNKNIGNYRHLKRYYDRREEENNELLAQLMITNRCLLLLEKYRHYLTLFRHNCKCEQNSDNKTDVDDLESEYKGLIIKVKLNSGAQTETSKDKTATIKKLCADNQKRTESVDTIATNARNTNINKSQTQTQLTAKLEAIDIDIADNSADETTDSGFQYYSSLLNSKDSLSTVSELIAIDDDNHRKTNSSSNSRDNNDSPHRAVDKKDSLSLFRCVWPSCELIYATERGLKSHVLSSHFEMDDRLLSCDLCGQAFERLPALTQHKRTAHAFYQPKLYECGIDGCRYVSKMSNLNRHKLSRHTNFRPYKCPFADCGKSFARNDGLKSHMRNHK